MQSDHNIILEKSKAQDLIIDQVIENSQQYSLYHFNKSLTQRQTLKNTDSFMSDLMNFFESRDLTRDIVDLIMQIAADALGLNIYICQQNILPNRQNGTKELHTEIIKMSGEQLCKDVYLKFTHNNFHPKGNHYEPLLKKEESEVKKYTKTLLKYLENTVQMSHVVHNNVFNPLKKQNNV